jgi:UDP-hydrolysing UDP-N-acetyl-D-glucosamine 2-epimerase
MGEEPNTVYVTGCPSIDLAKEIMADPALNFNPLQKYSGVGPGLDLTKGYVVVMHHPVTTEYELARDHVVEILHVIRDLKFPALWFWPNVDAGSDGTSKGIRSFREREKPDNIHFFKNMAPHDFLRLIHNCRCLIGNSSVGIRESSYLGVPVVNIGSRQSGRDRGENVIDSEYGRESIFIAIQKQMNNGHYQCDPIYGDGRAGEKIAKVLSEVPLSITKRLTY